MTVADDYIVALCVLCGIVCAEVCLIEAAQDPSRMTFYPGPTVAKSHKIEVRHLHDAMMP
jgi:hypothetical protein